MVLLVTVITVMKNKPLKYVPKPQNQNKTNLQKPTINLKPPQKKKLSKPTLSSKPNKQNKKRNSTVINDLKSENNNSIKKRKK